MQCPRCDRKLNADDRFCARCGLARSLDGTPVDPLIGLTVSERYRIEERIGVGGMGTVYRAQHVRFGQDVAIKVLHERHTGDEKLARRFEKEALTYGRVSHPNLVGLHDFGTTPDGMFFMALEYCPGQPLSTLLREKGQFSWRAATDIVMQVAQGLGAAHDCGVVHRDLKPENILMTEIRPNRYHVRLLDFGIAKREDEDGPRLTQAGMVFGTPEYMSPEQARGKAVDKRSDIYALGTLFYELISHPPFHGSDKLRVMQQQANESPVPPSEHLFQSLPIDLEALILKCLEKEPAERIQNTQVLLDEVEQITHGSALDISTVDAVAESWRADHSVSTSGLGVTIVGDTLNGSEMVSDDIDTHEHSPLSEGFNHQRITTQAKAYLPVMGAVFTILVIVIGGGLLVRGQAVDGDASAVAAHSAKDKVSSEQLTQKDAASTPILADQKPRSIASSGATEVGTNVPVKPVRTSESQDRKKDVPVANVAVSSAKPSQVDPLQKRLEQLEAAIKVESLTQAKTLLAELEQTRVKGHLTPTQETLIKKHTKSVTRLEKAREKQIKRLLAKGRKQLQSADFNQVQASLKKLRSLAASEKRVRELESTMQTARNALLKARRHYAKADCRRTLTTLKPIMAVTPKSKRVAKLVDACRQALPPQRL